MEAIREGVEDYEYLVMLRDRIRECEEAGKAGALLPRARRILDGACERVLTAEQSADYHWNVEKDRSTADSVRCEVLQILTALSQ